MPTLTNQLPVLASAKSLVPTLLTDAERAAIYAARWRVAVARRSVRL